MSSSSLVRAALSLNNAGVTLLRRGCIPEAIPVLENAVRFVKVLAGGRSVSFW